MKVLNFHKQQIMVQIKTPEKISVCLNEFYQVKAQGSFFQPRLAILKPIDNNRPAPK